ncbi:hypothetical protein [Companilactobacillus halodurans]|uniref:hypothetical protein n=1 Tax=Companilactobacillus halodurans TaxID=2584183 RepID=UPI001EE2B83D|nr:hypothetical protein [Companilactobacillus halodurans]
MSLEQHQLTDAKLVNHLFDFIEDGQKLEGIIVTKPCLTSGVDRKTFYRHYPPVNIVEPNKRHYYRQYVKIPKHFH